MEENPRFNKDLLSQLYEGVYVVDKSRRIIFWNDGSERISGYGASEVTNRQCHQNVLQHIDENGTLLCVNGCPLKKTLISGEINETFVYLRHKQGHRIPVNVKAIPVFDTENKIVAAIEIFTDERFQKDVYSENQSLKDKLRIDALTNIANRSYFEYRLDVALNEAKRFGKTFGILIADIDNFKSINDRFGHDVGDEILKLVSRTLAANVKKDDFVSRWGGEEFGGVFFVDNLGDLTAIAERLRIVVERSSHILDTGEETHITISVGGAFHQKGEDSKTLFRRTDANLYHAKTHGRNRIKVS